jgi:hypothetical protein
LLCLLLGNRNVQGFALNGLHIFANLVGFIGGNAGIFTRFTHGFTHFSS